MQTDWTRVRAALPVILTVPGLDGSGPDHWQTEWEYHLPDCRRVQMGDWSHPERERWVVPSTFLFMLGYLFVWTCCALAATLADWLLHDAGALDEAMAITNPTAGALALVAAGVYQWTPAKHVCLDNCRAPLAFVLTHWRRGMWGAFRMGVTDARYCTGCCWLLLALVLPAGVLNLPVIAGLIALILAEKLLPGGHLVACATGLGLVALGTKLLFP